MSEQQQPKAKRKTRKIWDNKRMKKKKEMNDDECFHNFSIMELGLILHNTTCAWNYKSIHGLSTTPHKERERKVVFGNLGRIHVSFF